MSDIAKKYRLVFSGPDGQAVLDDICLRGGLLDRIDTDEQRSRENFAKEILAMALGDDEQTVRRSTFMDLLKRLRRTRNGLD